MKTHPATHETGDHVDTLLMQSSDVHRLIPVGFTDINPKNIHKNAPLVADVGLI